MNKILISLYILLFFFFCFSKSYADFNQQWVNRVYVSHYNSSSPSILLDKDGNIYVLSRSDSISVLHPVIKLTKYFSNGTQSWTVNYNNPSNTSQTPISFIVVNNSDIFILGQAMISTNSDYLVLKYNSSGTFQWANQYDSPGYDVPTGFTIDNSGNIFVTGTSHFNGTSQPVPNTIKISPSGTLLWHKSLAAIYMAYITGGIVTDVTGNIYFQYSYANFELSLDNLIKYNSNGDTLWNYIVDTLHQSFSNYHGLERDSSNNIYYALQVNNNNFGRLSIFKYDVSGNRLTSYNYIPGVYGSYIYLNDYKIMGNNNLLITGVYTNSPPAKSQLLFLMYNQAGNLLKTIRTSYNSNFDCWGSALAIDQNSNIFICGQTNISANNSNYLTIKYNSTGDSQYCVLYNGPVSNDGATGIAADTIGNVYVTGLSMNTDSNYSAATVKYSQLVGINKVSKQIPEKFSLSQNYPNPFNPSTNIKYQIPKTSFVKLTIYDVLGKEIATLVKERLQPGTYEVEWDGRNYSSGVYFYKLTIEDASTPLSITRKMVLVK